MGLNPTTALGLVRSVHILSWSIPWSSQPTDLPESKAESGKYKIFFAFCETFPRVPPSFVVVVVVVRAAGVVLALKACDNRSQKSVLESLQLSVCHFWKSFLKPPSYGSNCVDITWTFLCCCRRLVTSSWTHLMRKSRVAGEKKRIDNKLVNSFFFDTHPL